MQLLQTYETSIFDRDNKWNLAFLVVPQRTTSTKGLSLNLPEIAEALDLEIPVETMAITISRLPEALSAILVADAKGGSAQDIFEAAVRRRIDETLAADYGSAMRFAEQVCFCEVLPFEQSPVAGASIATLLAKSGGVGVGAYVGFALSGSTPLALITVPLGMIICGAASGAAMGLQDGLRKLTSQWLTGKTKKTDRPKKKKTETKEKELKESLRNTLEEAEQFLREMDTRLPRGKHEQQQKQQEQPQRQTLKSRSR